MATETLVIDSATDTPGATALTLTNPGAGIDVMSIDYGNPDRKTVGNSSFDVQGTGLADAGYGGRKITLTVRCYGASMRTRYRELSAKLGAVAESLQGVLKRTLSNGDTISFDLRDAQITSAPVDWRFVQRDSAEVTIELLAETAGRGPSSTYTTATETTNPELVFTVASPAGDLPALGKLEITDLSGNDQWFCHWGVQTRYYSGSATAALAFAGTSRLMLNGATALAVAGALSGTLVNQATLTADPIPFLSLASSGTVYLSHVGDFGVWARTYQGASNAGTVSVALEWATGDLARPTVNDTAVLEPTSKGQFRHVYLGQVNLPPATLGTSRWDAKILGASNGSSDTVGIDRLYLFPVAEGYGEIRGLQPAVSPSSLVARDEFNQTAGTATGKTLTAGGTWASLGAGTADFTVNATDHTLRRPSYVPLGGGGARILHNNTNYTSVSAQVDVYMLSNTTATSSGGPAARAVDASNYLAVSSASGSVTVFQVIGGVGTTLASLPDALPASGWVTLRLVVTTAGRWNLYGASTGSPLRLLASGYLAALTAGGTLATGKAGVYDPGGSGDERLYDNFRVASPPSDAAIFAAQSLVIGPNYAVRKDSSGTVYGPASSYRGSYVQVPASGIGGTARLIIKASRTDPDLGGGDLGIDDISAVLTVTPRYHQVP